MKIDVLYRGPLESCNYGCDYCPFAKKEEGAEELSGDKRSLERFLGFLRGRIEDRIGVLFTPWGEALVRKWYRDALIELTHLPNIRRAAAQTNLSMSLDFVDDCDPSKLGIWATYHPKWGDRRRFVERVGHLHDRGVSVSAGIVGFAKFHSEAAELRAELPREVYMWINAPKRFETFDASTIESLSAIDPLFGFNTRQHQSLGERCFTGADTVSIDGDGNVRRCHFIEEIIGNIYEDDISTIVGDRPCPAETCGCHLGYVHLERLGLRPVFGEGILERSILSRP